MPSIFISHSSVDNAIAFEVKSWLSQQGFENVFLDFDKSSGIGAGKDWARELYEAVSRCQAVVIIATENWTRSRWCFAEAQQAQALGKMVFPIVIAANELTHVEAEFRARQVVVWDEDGKDNIAARLREIVDELARGYAWDNSRPPWVGIMSLETDDAAVFFGRDNEIVDIAQKLDARRALGGPPLTFLVGASGSGKSSLLKAGVLPYLSRSIADWITLPPFRPGADPVSSLVNAFTTRIEPRAPRARTILDTDPKLALTMMAAELRRGQSGEATILIAIDQMEELFSVTPSDQRHQFFKILRFMLDGDRSRRFLAIATIRSDRLGDFLADDDFPLGHEALTVGPMPRSRLRLVIEGPARVAGLTVEPTLVDRILVDAGRDGDTLPLIAFALRDMYDRRDRAKTLSVAQYERLGDPARGLRPLENVVRRTAEMVTDSISPSDIELRAVKEAFVGSLVRIGEDGTRMTRPSRMTEISRAALPVLDALVQARLLTTRGEGDQREIEVSHEAFLRVWPQLSAWLDEEQEFLLGRRQIEDARSIWLSAPEEKKKDALLSGLVLQRARRWYSDFPHRLARVKDFVTRSLERDRAIQIRRRFWIGTACTFVLAATLMLTGLTIWASNQRGKAEAAANAAALQRDRVVKTRSTLLADLGRQRNDLNDFSTGMALAIAALTNPYSAEITDSAEAERVLRHALWNLREKHVLNLGHSLYVAVVVFSPDGKRLLTGSADGVARLWDVATGHLIRAMIGHQSGVRSAAFSSDASMIATGDDRGGLRVWRGDTGELIRTLRAHEQMLTSLEFSRDGKRLLSASWDYTARIDDPYGLAREVSLYGHANHVWTARFSRDEQAVITAAEDGLRIFSAIDGHLIQENRNIRGVLYAAYSPAGDTIITVDRSGQLTSWDSSTGALRFRRTDLNAACTDCASFSADGSRIGAGSKGGVTIFDAATGNVIARTRTMETQPAHHVRFTPDGQYLFSEAENGSARLDRVSEGSNFELFSGHADFIDAIAVSPDSRTFATGARDGTVRLWSPDPVAGSSYLPFRALSWGAYSPDGKTMAVAELTIGENGFLGFYSDEDKTYQKVLPRHHDEIRLGGFSLDGTRVVTVSQGNAIFQRDGKQIFEPPMVMLWDTAKRELVANLSSHTDQVNSAVFSPDSTRLLTASNDGTARLWNAADGLLLATLSGHDGIVLNAIFSSDGNRLVTISGDRTARLWDRNGDLIKVLKGHTDAVRHVALSPDGSLVATGSDDFSIRIWASEDGTPADVWTGHGGGFHSLRFSSNTRLVSASSDGTVRLWGLGSPQPLVVSDKRSYNGGQSATSDDGTLVSMTWGDAEVRVFDTAAGDLVRILKTMPSAQFQYFVPKSHVLMVTSNYGAEFWSLPAGNKIGDMRLPFAFGQTIFFAESGDRFAVKDLRGLRQMFIWPTTAALLSTAKQFSAQDLSTDQRYSRFLQ